MMFYFQKDLDQKSRTYYILSYLINDDGEILEQHPP